MNSFYDFSLIIVLLQISRLVEHIKQLITAVNPDVTFITSDDDKELYTNRSKQTAQSVSLISLLLPLDEAVFVIGIRVGQAGGRKRFWSQLNN